MRRPRIITSARTATVRIARTARNVAHARKPFEYISFIKSINGRTYLRDKWIEAASINEKVIVCKGDGDILYIGTAAAPNE